MAIALAMLGQAFAVQAPLDNDKQVLRVRTFETVWQRVQDHYFDPSFSGVDWAEVKVRYTQKLAEELTDDQFYDLLNNMLHELKQSHFGVIPPKAYAAEEEAAKRGTGANAGMAHSDRRG